MALKEKISNSTLFGHSGHKQLTPVSAICVSCFSNPVAAFGENVTSLSFICKSYAWVSCDIFDLEKTKLYLRIRRM